MGRLSAGVVNKGLNRADNQGLSCPSEPALERHEVAKIPLRNSDLTTDLVSREIAPIDQAPHRLVGDRQNVGDLLKGQEPRLRLGCARHD